MICNHPPFRCFCGFMHPGLHFRSRGRSFHAAILLFLESPGMVACIPLENIECQQFSETCCKWAPANLPDLVAEDYLEIFLHGELCNLVVISASSSSIFLSFSLSSSWLAECEAGFACVGRFNNKDPCLRPFQTLLSLPCQFNRVPRNTWFQHPLYGRDLKPNRG